MRGALRGFHAVALRAQALLLRHERIGESSLGEVGSKFSSAWKEVNVLAPCLTPGFSGYFLT